MQCAVLPMQRAAESSPSLHAHASLRALPGGAPKSAGQTSQPLEPGSSWKVEAGQGEHAADPFPHSSHCVPAGHCTHPCGPGTAPTSQRQSDAALLPAGDVLNAGQVAHAPLPAAPL